jgi:hypothetical protein
VTGACACGKQCSRVHAVAVRFVARDRSEATENWEHVWCGAPSCRIAIEKKAREAVGKVRGVSERSVVQ